MTLMATAAARINASIFFMPVSSLRFSIVKLSVSFTVHLGIIFSFQRRISFIPCYNASIKINGEIIDEKRF